ncbi:hypothetical protein BGW36DRAFT_432676 [Talaromyces proteolyticus]|uniref:Uncharacterized protein n=1 Tax=Talaromyces proteolyticus TaxID=1131652 RepID=A0AAD4KFQ2_9EURO|nr:uncharacterized protein BGW36DRAFT_432676 [Talaromyces proteolyticus]KAH8690900.1 hypothetical protein BGW36DRAFT_432676 [Talaromyces proteolyticus]
MDINNHHHHHHHHHGVYSSLHPTQAVHSLASEVNDANQNRAHLIVGIDFGTVFSSVAFAFVANNEVREDIITEWPGTGTLPKQEIPTVLYYDGHQNVVGWGLDIVDAIGSIGYPKAGVQKVEWFKQRLMLSGNADNDHIEPYLPHGKSEIDVAADYFCKIRQVIHTHLQKTLGEAFRREEKNIHYYLTVPVVCSDAAKAATRAAATQAGLLSSENETQLTFIEGPKATAMYYVKTGLFNWKLADAILIVDCGGGTVDLVAYEVTRENPFALTECTTGSGDSCGSIALSRNFAKMLRAKIRRLSWGDRPGRLFAKCISDFENRIKSDFHNNGQKWSIDVGVEADYPEADIQDGYMSFTNEEILQCFEPVVNRILELVHNQINAIQAHGHQLQNVLIVGGFSASEYLFREIKLRIPSQFQSKVVRPMDSASAIVKGAVMVGIAERVVTHRIAHRHNLSSDYPPSSHQ